MPDFPGYTDTGNSDPGLFPPWDMGGTPAPTSPGYPPEGAPPNTPFPGSPPSQPPPVSPPAPTSPGGPDPSIPPSPQPPPIGFDPAGPPGGFDSSGWASVWSPLFRRRTITRASQAELLLRRGVRELGKAAVDAWTRLQRGPELKLGGGGPPRGGLPTIYREPLPPTPRVMVTPVSVVVGLLAGLYPRGLFQSAEKPLTDRERISDPLAVYRMWDPKMIGLPNPTEPKPYTDPRRVPDLELENIPRPARPDQDLMRFLRRAARGEVQDFGRDWLAQQLGVPRSTLPYPAREQGPPEPKTNIGDITNKQAPAPQPQPITPQVGQVTIPSSVSSPRGTSRVGRKPRAGRIFTFGGIGTAVLLIEASRRGRSPPSLAGSPDSPIAPTPTPAIPGPVPLTPVVTGVQSYAPAYFGGASGDGYCVPRPRGPKRKCLERAPVKYSGGRRKGKAAGTKCLRWEAPKR